MSLCSITARPLARCCRTLSQRNAGGSGSSGGDAISTPAKTTALLAASSSDANEDEDEDEDEESARFPLLVQATKKTRTSRRTRMAQRWPR